MSRVPLFFCVAAFLGCAGPRVVERADPAAMAALQVSKQEPPPGCQSLGAVEGKDVAAFHMPMYEVALDRARAKAVARGANYLVLDAVRQPGPNAILVSGRVFQCATATPPPVTN